MAHPLLLFDPKQIDFMLHITSTTVRPKTVKQQHQCELTLSDIYDLFSNSFFLYLGSQFQPDQ